MSPPVVMNLALLVLGWALGILSSPITDAIRRHSVKQRITRAIGTELRSLQDAFAVVVIQVSGRRGALTHSLLEALMSTLMTSGHTVATSKALKVIDERVSSGAGERPAPGDTERASRPVLLSLKVQGVPFLESHLHRMDFYAHETQRQLLEICAGSQIFNQVAEEAVHYQFLAFSRGIDPETMAALAASIEKCHEQAAEKASELIAQIAVLLRNPEMQAH
ncbi:MAG TPA: hypothetical protein VI792_06550 [Candidatus Eisenbacteria bacterium]